MAKDTKPLEEWNANAQDVAGSARPSRSPRTPDLTIFAPNRIPLVRNSLARGARHSRATS